METSLRVDNPWEGSPVFVRESVSSTMDDARELAIGGCPAGTVVVAGFQGKGRGRVPGRSWHSRPWESLLATLVLDSRAFGFPLGQIPLRASVAVCLAASEMSGVQLQIKWPNDVVHDGKKLAGILCETCGSAMLVGLGVNCTQRDFPPELSGRVCSLLQAGGSGVQPLLLLPRVLARMKAVLEDMQWREKLLSRLASRGVRVRVSPIGSETAVEGIVRDVDDQGMLVLETENGVLVKVSQGELR